MDRFFLHCPGANDTFSSADVDYDLVAEAALFHFGYPPVMRRMYADSGRNLMEVLIKAKTTGVTTSLDMTFPDPSSDGGRVDWQVIYKAGTPLCGYLPAQHRGVTLYPSPRIMNGMRGSPGGDSCPRSPRSCLPT